ncbi:MAG: energy transducer TonB [Alphaproteobacteria bacterium]|nr:energy transducer TonB [Alphaproteobacteria bacterium]
MTIPLPLNAFDHGQAVAPKTAGRPLDRGRLVSLALTIAFHAVAIGALLAMVHVAPVRVLKEMTVHINLDKPKQDADVAPPPPTFVQPTAVTVPLPVVPPVAPAPVMVATPPPVAAPMPPPPAPAPKAESGQARQDFVARLLAQLNRFKQYPRAARQAHIQGVVMLHFVMDASGRVLTADIAKSSGRPILDQEALALIRRAQPLPPLPADYPTRTLDAVVPVEFSLNG